MAFLQARIKVSGTFSIRLRRPASKANQSINQSINPFVAFSFLLLYLFFFFRFTFDQSVVSPGKAQRNLIIFSCHQIQTFYK